MRLGIFGGSFDPVHYGHLVLAEMCREQCRLDTVWFLPAQIPPHKQAQSLSSQEHRLEMLRLAIGGHPQFEISLLEVERGGVSYTVDTLESVRQDHPEAELFLLMGADSLLDLPNWRRPDRICELAAPVVASRKDSPEPDFRRIGELVSPERLEEIRHHQVEMPVIELSSTELRDRVASKRSIRFLTPRAVEVYIQEKGLYRL